MSKSSNSLFHITREFSTLKSILSNKALFGSYCKETLSYNGERVPLIIPMICFCDIPLTTISNHSAYGKYGIGLKKEWGIRNKLNPVLYMEKESALSESLIKSLTGSLKTVNLISDLITLEQDRIKGIDLENIPAEEKLRKKIPYISKIKNLASISDSVNFTIYSLYFTKHYQDDLERSGEVIKNYRFYDEREWRYIPEFQCAVCELRRTEDEYKQWRGTTEQKPVLKEVKLTFDCSDIEYVIVEKNEEKKEIIDLIKKLASDSCPPEEIESLYTKIISFEQIKNDY